MHPNFGRPPQAGRPTTPAAGEMKDVLTTVFVRSLPYDATDAALEEHFSEAGPVRSAFVVKDRATQQGRGFGFVTFALPEDAAQAVSTMGGSLFQGRRLAQNNLEYITAPVRG